MFFLQCITIFCKFTATLNLVLMTNSTHVLTIQFRNEISWSEIPFLRGAVIQALHGQANVLYHNHTGDSYRYAYPLIQYKRIRNKAAIFCLKEGTEVIGQFLSEGNFSLLLGERPVEMEIEKVFSKKYTVQTWDSEFRYRIRRWLPLNADNYQKYREMDECSEKISFLENILIANLLSFAKGIGIHIESEIKCKLSSLSAPYQVTNKGVKLMAFDAEFKTNMSLPDYVGIGKNASIGFGVVTHICKDK